MNRAGISATVLAALVVGTPFASAAASDSPTLQS